MTDPLRMTFEVGCSAEHAFTVWTSGIDGWWPRDHTVTRGEQLQVVLEPRVGGRVFERTADGDEHQWGEVTTWDPPERVGYTWYLGTEPAMATDVEIRFVAREIDVTEVVIEHSGWERLADVGAALRDRNHLGWSTLLPHFTAALEQGDA
jgi:uncharacterized protein YndB with AHSA1/START domain